MQLCGLIHWLLPALSSSALENQHKNTPHPPAAADAPGVQLYCGNYVDCAGKVGFQKVLEV
jgi:hypothetical protein